MYRTKCYTAIINIHKFGWEYTKEKGGGNNPYHTVILWHRRLAFHTPINDSPTILETTTPLTNTHTKVFFNISTFKENLKVYDYKVNVEITTKTKPSHRPHTPFYFLYWFVLVCDSSFLNELTSWVDCRLQNNPPLKP